MLPDVPEGDPERDLSLQHEGASQEHVGAQARVQTLQGAEIEPCMRPASRAMANVQLFMRTSQRCTCDVIYIYILKYRSKHSHIVLYQIALRNRPLKQFIIDVAIIGFNRTAQHLLGKKMCSFKR